VKICGITRYEDASAAFEAGADAIGIVLTTSRRKADPLAVQSWIHTIKGMEKVGVFMDEDPGYIAETASMLGLTAVQLHTTFREEHKLLLDRFNIILAFNNLEQAVIPEGFPGRLLLDASIGSGTTCTWKRYDRPFILAGGLEPGNVREAIRQASPFGVDVSTGVEISPGIKDKDKIRRFIQEAKT